MAIISSLGAVSGSPKIDADTCTLCWACTDVYPTGTLVRDDGAVRVDLLTEFGCIACGQCMAACPTDSVTVTGRGLEPAHVVALPDEGGKATAEQIETLMLGRRSIRRFTDDEIPQATLERVVAAAAMAPMGIPPWEVGVVILQGRSKVAEISHDVAAGYAGMLKVMDRKLVLGALGLFMKKAQLEQLRSFIIPLGRQIVQARQQGQDLVFYNAPAALLFHASPYADAADAVIACTYAMLAAESLGLGSCMIGSAPPVLARSKATLAKLGIPRDHKPALALILGYPAVEFANAIRRRFLSMRTY